MSLQSPTFEHAKEHFKPMKRTAMKRRPIKSSAIPYGTNSLSRKKKGKKKNSVRSLKKRVWTEFSKFIRTRNASCDGINRCFTCPTYLHWKELHAGHFVRGRLNANLFDERGCQPQCHRCNIHFQGNVVIYYGAMQELYGQKVIDELIQQNNQTKKWIPGELATLLGHYEALNAANPLLAESR